MASNSIDTTTLHENYEKPKLKGDILNLMLLTIFYILQGAVGGIVLAIPNILQKRNVNYEDQAVFNTVWYPLSLKIFWAPIVDSVYFKKIGRRKSWVVTTQYFTGVLLLLISMNVDDWLGTEDGERKPNVRSLTVAFFLCMLSNSIQDIAVDAWSLTIFQKRNVPYSAVCQSIGLSSGFVLVSASFIMLESTDFCNYFRSVPQDHGFVSFAEFIFFWSMMFMVMTTLTLIFKKENENSIAIRVENNLGLRIKETYVLVWKVLRLRPIQMLCFFLFTRHISTGPIYNVAPLKLLDSGITRSTLALSTVPLFPIQLFLTLVLNRYVTGRRPLRTFLLFYILKLVNGIVYASLVFFISYWKKKHNVLPSWYYWPLVFVHNFDSVGYFVMMMAVVASLARISDPHFGGVYMTLFNSINNVGNFWPSTVCLWLVNFLTIRSCIEGGPKEISCDTIIDGFYVEVFLCGVIGALWLFWAKQQIYNLEEMDANVFIVKQSPTIIVKRIQRERTKSLIVIEECSSEVS